MLASYPALFYYDDSENIPYFVSFPNFEDGSTQGEDVSDAMYMASDWLGINVADCFQKNRDLPKASNIKVLSLDGNNPFPNELNYDKDKSFISMVLVDLSDYLDDDELVKKTLTIPKWTDKAGKELKLNFSQTLTDAITEKNWNKESDSERVSQKNKKRAKFCSFFIFKITINVVLNNF